MSRRPALSRLRALLLVEDGLPDAVRDYVSAVLRGELPEEEDVETLAIAINQVIDARGLSEAVEQVAIEAALLGLGILVSEAMDAERRARRQAKLERFGSRIREAIARRRSAVSPEPPGVP